MNTLQRLESERLSAKLRLNAEIVVGDLEQAAAAQRELEEIDQQIQEARREAQG